MDFERVIQTLKSDPEALKKLVLIGVFLFIPIAGPIAIYGWQRRVFDAASQGRDEIPDPNFGADLSYGIDPFIAALNALPIVFVAWVLCFGVPMLIAAGLGAALGNSDAAALVGVFAALANIIGMLVFMATILGVALINPELLHRGYLGERFPLFSPGASIARIKANMTPYIVLLVSTFVANFIGGLGIYLCCVGIILTNPVAAYAKAHFAGQWHAKAHNPVG